LKFAAMRDALKHQRVFEDVKARIAQLPVSERNATMIDFFVDVLAEMSPDRIRQLRGQVVERFGGSGQTSEACALMLELIDAHLALRSRRTAKRN
jgi:hypothetical protein